MQNTKPSVELCIVNWSTEELIQESLQNLLENTDYPLFHVSVLDNCSLDDSWNKIKELCYIYPGRINAYQSHINLGYGAALNVLSRLTEADYICCMNSDIFVESKKDWISPLINTFKEIEDVGIVAPKLKNRDGLLMGGPVLGTNGKHVIKYWFQPDNGQFDTVLECVTLSGACLLLPRELFLSLGGFDEQFQHYYEDEDLCYMLRSEGYKVIYQPNACLIHEHQQSSSDQRLLQTHAGIGKKLIHQKWGEEWFNNPKEFTEEGVVD